MRIVPRVRAFSLLALCTVMLSVSLDAWAASGPDASEAFGTYETKGDYWQRVKISRGKKAGQLIGSFEVATHGCQGDVVMNGKMTKVNSAVFIKKDEDMGSTCTISVEFSSGFRSIKVSHEYCGYSGPACDFNGEMKRAK